MNSGVKFIKTVCDSITVVSLSDFYFPLNNFPHNEHVLLTYLYDEHVLPIYPETKRLNFLWSNSFNHRKAFLYQFMPLQPLNRTKCKLSSRTMIRKTLTKLIKVFFFKTIFSELYQPYVWGSGTICVFQQG